MGRVIKHQTTCKINNAFGPGTAKKCTESSGSRSFAKEMRALKMRSGWPLEGDNNQLRAIIKADLTTTREVAKEFNIY